MICLKDLHKDSLFGCLISGKIPYRLFLFLHGAGMTLKHCKEGPAKKTPLGFIQPLGLTELQPTWSSKRVYDSSM